MSSKRELTVYGTSRLRGFNKDAMTLLGQSRDSWPSMAPLGHVELTKMQKLLKSKTKTKMKKTKWKQKWKFFFYIIFVFVFCFHFRFCFCFHFHFHFCFHFYFCFRFIFSVFIFKFYYGTSILLLRHHTPSNFSWKLAAGEIPSTETISGFLELSKI